MRRILKDRFAWYLAVLLTFTCVFAYSSEYYLLPEIYALERWAPDYYTALYRLLFITSVVITAWRFGVKAGLAACSFLGLVLLPLYIERIGQSNVWIDLGVLLIGIIFSWMTGRQGEIKRLAEKSADDLTCQTAKLNREIAERKRVEEEIRQSEERYRLLAENVTDVIWKVNVDSPTVANYISPSITYLLGYTVEEAMSKTMEEIFTPESFNATMQALAKEKAAMDGEDNGQHRSVTMELELKRKDGSTVAVETNYTIVRNCDGKPVEILALTRNISDRKNMEHNIKQAAEEWRMTFDSSSDAISIHSRDHRILRANKAFADLFNMEPKQLIGKYCYELMHGTKEPAQDCPHRQTLSTGKPATTECHEPHLEIYLQKSTSPIFNEKGKVVSTVHIVRDVTERRRREEQLMLTDRLASIGELVSGVAHELNNPLTSVIGFSQLLMERDIDDDMKAELTLVNNEAQRCARIVKNLLTFARKHAPVKQLSQINNIIDDMLKLRAYEQRVNNIEVKKRFAVNLPEIMVDYFQMQQVFLNIIINAEHIMIQTHNKGVLTIVTKKLDDIVRISITDDGPGIPKENLARIFDPFFTTKEVGKGTGLGLSICHGIVSEHGGKIYAKSEPNKGTTFFVDLPINTI